MDKLDKNIQYKTVIQYSEVLSDENFSQIIFMQNVYRKIKSYTYHRLRNISNFNSLNFIKVRNKWMKDGVFNQWSNIPTHLKYMAVDDAIGQIKSKHSNLKLKIKKLNNANINLNSDEKHYVNFILGKDLLWSNILNNIELTEDELYHKKFNGLNFNKLNNYIKRLTRKYNTKMVAKSDRSLLLYATLYKSSKGLIKISSPIKNKRIVVKTLDKKFIPKGNITIVLNRDNQTIELHSLIKTNKIENNNKAIIGIDKGFTDLIATSTSNIYGKNSSMNIKKKSDYLTEKYKKRNNLYQIAKKHKENGNEVKYNNIISNNLGNKKINKKKKKFDGRIKTNINTSINDFIKTEKPKEVIVEDLNFVSNNKKYGKKVNRYLSSWQKGYLQKQLEHKFSFNGITLTKINPAYTSQVCSLCGSFGIRNGKNFTCETHGTVDADINASKNIEIRKYIRNINVYTPYLTIKTILKRLSENYILYSVSTKTNKKLSFLYFVRAN